MKKIFRRRRRISRLKKSRKESRTSLAFRKKSKHYARLFPPLSPVTCIGTTIFTRVDRVPLLLSSAECFLIQNRESCVSFLKINVFFVGSGTAEGTFLKDDSRKGQNKRISSSSGSSLTPSPPPSSHNDEQSRQYSPSGRFGEQEEEELHWPARPVGLRRRRRSRVSL